MAKLIIFDFWGTLVMNGIYSPVKQVKFIIDNKDEFSDYIIKFEDVFMTKEFGSLEEGFGVVMKAFDMKEDNNVVEKLIGMWNKNMLLSKMFPDTLDVLQELKKNYKVALLSNTDNFSAPQVLEKFDLAKHFDYVYLSCKEGKLKNNPGSFEMVLDALKIDKKDAIMVGDSIESDMNGAEKAGIKSILVDRRGRREYAHKIVFLSELPAKLQEMGK